MIPRFSSRAVGLAILAAILVFAAAGPFLTNYDPRYQDLLNVLQPPGHAAHILGTDHLGRDVFSRLAYAVRLTAGLALLNVAVASLLGTSLGLFAAWRGGAVEQALSAVADAIMALPGLLLVLLLLAFAPGQLWPIALALSLTLWVEYFRVVRARTRVLLTGPQVESSTLLGFGPFYIARRHLWPDLAPMIGTLMCFGAATSVLALAAVGFVGAGLHPPTAELGLMMSEWFAYYLEAPWLLAMAVGTLALGILGLALAAGKDGAA